MNQLLASSLIPCISIFKVASKWKFEIWWWNLEFGLLDVNCIKTLYEEKDVYFPWKNTFMWMKIKWPFFFFFHFLFFQVTISMLSIIITKPYDKCFTFLTKMFLKTPISVILCTQLYMDFGFIQEITIKRRSTLSKKRKHGF